MTSVARLHPEADDREDNAEAQMERDERAAFERLMAEWRSLTAVARLATGETDEQAEASQLAYDRHVALSHRVAAHPTRDIGAILGKLELLEHETLEAIATGSAMNQRALVILGCIRADLMGLQYWPDVESGLRADAV